MKTRHRHLRLVPDCDHVDLVAEDLGGDSWRIVCSACEVIIANQLATYLKADSA
jgi:hypothetical protein